MLENVRQNLVKWGSEHKWGQEGDEWKGQAAVCKKPYEEWKQSLVNTLLLPNVFPGAAVLEIAPGHGRWSEFLVKAARHAILVDLSGQCLEFCRQRFEAATNVEYYLTTGVALPKSCSDAIDFVWSFDSFVHMDPAVVDSYLHEIKRVLRPGGRAVIHHADIDDLSTHKQSKHPGWRSPVNRALVKDIASRAGLEVESQLTYWDEAGGFGVPRFNDKISIFRKDSV